MKAFMPISLELIIHVRSEFNGLGKKRSMS